MKIAKHIYFSITLFSGVLFFNTQITDVSSFSIKTNEPWPFYICSNDTVILYDSLCNSNSNSGKLYINLLIDSSGNKLSYAITAYDYYCQIQDSVKANRFVDVKHTAYLIYRDSLNCKVIYPKRISLVYEQIRDYIGGLEIIDTGHPKIDEYYSLNFVLHVIYQ